MEHELYFDGTLTEYSWSIKTENKIVNQIREHPPAYLSGGKLDVKDKQQSKCIAIHLDCCLSLTSNIPTDRYAGGCSLI